MKVTLTIPLLNGETWKVDATVIGDLAIHRARKDERLWSVTHIPTLLTLAPAVPAWVCSDKKKLMKWAVCVQEGVKKDWLAMKKVTAKDINENPERTKGLRFRILDYCAKRNAEDFAQ